MTQPNIIYIHSHDTGRYVQPYGYAVHTPAIQRLAEQGVTFRQAFCVNPTCSPSRASLLTGQWPHQNGMIGLVHRGSRLRDPGQCLPWMLKSRGYGTALIGIQHEASDATSLGYDEVNAIADDELISQHAASYLRRQHDRPFFLSVGFFLTHRVTRSSTPNWHNGDRSPTGDHRFVRPPAPLPDTLETRRDFTDFSVAVSRLDRCMGVVFDALEQAGLSENTLVICTTDHGIAFPGMKCNLTDHGLGVMLILRGPGGFAGGQMCDAMVTHMDLFPTICEMIGAVPPAWLEGTSLYPLVRNETNQVHDAIFAQVNYHAAYEPIRAVRTQRYAYIRRFDPVTHPATNCDAGASKDFWMKHGWSRSRPDMEQLYDLVFDPNEADNLVNGDRAIEVLANMRDRLYIWMCEKRDPLLDGPVVRYPNMIVRGPNGEPSAS